MGEQSGKKNTGQGNRHCNPGGPAGAPVSVPVNTMDFISSRYREDIPSGCKFAHFMGGNLHVPWAGATLDRHVKETEPPKE